MIREGVGSRLVKDWLKRAIAQLDSTWVHPTEGTCTWLHSRAAHYFTEHGFEVQSSFHGGRGSEIGSTQLDDGSREDASRAAAAESPSEDSPCEEMASMQTEDESAEPLCSTPWREPNKEVASHLLLQSGALSKRLMKLPSHFPVVPSLQQWLADGQALHKNNVVIALSNLKREGRYKQASELADFVWRERIYCMDDVDHMYRLYLSGSTGTVEQVEKCFASIPTKWLTEKVYNQLISFYIKKDMLLQAKNVLEKLKYSGQAISASPFNQFMSLYRHQREPKKALELMKEMNMSNVAPDTRTYNILLSIINKQGEADEVIRNYKAMKDGGIAFNTLTFSLVAKAYISAGMLDEAETLAHEMEEKDSKNSHLLHDLLLTVYADQKRPEDLRRVWKDVEKKSKISARSYGVMIESLGKLGLVQEAERVARKAEKLKRKLVLQVCNALMDVYGRHGMMDTAEQLLLRLHKEGLKANCTTYRHLVVGYLKIGQCAKAAENLRASKKILHYAYSRPWVESFVLFLDFLAERGEVDMAEQSIKYFSKPMSISTYNVLLKAYVRAGIKAPNFLQRMSADGVMPDAKTLGLLSELESM